MQLIINIEDEQLVQRLNAESQSMAMTNEERVLELLNYGLAPIENFEQGKQAEGVQRIKNILKQIPAITWVSTSEEESAYWWLKFEIDIENETAWNVVQELGFVLNYISINEPLPTVLKPVSPPPYLNEGGAKEHLSWVIEPTMPNLDPNIIAAFLEERLPTPLDDVTSWKTEQ